MSKRPKALLCAAGLAALVVACTTEPAPSKGTYTIAFPSTAAAVATDFVQVLVFDVAGKDRGALCQDLITTRLTSPDTLAPSVNPPAVAVNICAMLGGRLPVDVPYGEHALLAIAQRQDAQDQDLQKDFMIGCAIMSIGEGDAPIPIPVRLVNVGTPVPPTKCGSVGEFCDKKCL